MLYDFFFFFVFTKNVKHYKRSDVNRLYVDYYHQLVFSKKASKHVSYDFDKFKCLYQYLTFWEPCAAATKMIRNAVL